MSDHYTASESLDHLHFGWWVAVLGGVGVLALLAFHGPSYGTWCALATPVLSQREFRLMLLIVVIGHVTEAVYALQLVRRLGFERHAARWVVQTLIVGYPSLRILQRHRPRAQ